MREQREEREGEREREKEKVKGLDVSANKHEQVKEY
jgi:hypothetical protein